MRYLLQEGFEVEGYHPRKTSGNGMRSMGAFIESN
jgi:hypothetical protein